ncbi:MAG: type II toxin-antitoxin system HicB family antitoxin [Chloroflexota bacterium]|nr:type II toxin-antitoxin system HicB family antitoxin [Chloroflexota bacterium]MDE2883712.1 type II toxin-antitoxin system HicB family antitoxin [Chloroflexota bacterium]
MQNRFHVTIHEDPFTKGYFALCAEVKGVKGEGKTPQLAQSALVAALTRELESRRDAGVKEAPPGATVTTVTVDESYHAKAIRFEEDRILEQARRIQEARKKEATGEAPPWKGTLHNEFTAIVEYDGDWYGAFCPEVGGIGQGKTIPEAIDNLADACALLLMVDRDSGLARPEDDEAPILKNVTVSIGERATVV